MSKDRKSRTSKDGTVHKQQLSFVVCRKCVSKSYEIERQRPEYKDGYFRTEWLQEGDEGYKDSYGFFLDKRWHKSYEINCPFEHKVAYLKDIMERSGLLSVIRGRLNSNELTEEEIKIFSSMVSVVPKKELTYEANIKRHYMFMEFGDANSVIDVGNYMCRDIRCGFHNSIFRPAPEWCPHTEEHQRWFDFDGHRIVRRRDIVGVPNITVRYADGTEEELHISDYCKVTGETYDEVLKRC